MKVNKNILLACLYFKNLTGSEIYYYEVAKVLVRMGYNVTVGATSIGSGKLTDLINEEDYDEINIVKLNEIKPFQFKNFGLIIASHYPVVQYLCNVKSQLHLQCKLISINHHEHYNLEQPFISLEVDRYIGIRPAIAEKLQSSYCIKNPAMIWNPFDFERYEPQPIKQFDETKQNTILYCGTIDYVRKESIYDMAQKCQDKGWKLLLVGDYSDNYLPDVLNRYKCVEYHPSTNDIEDYIEKADATAGVFLGRTTIEGWLMGIPGFIYILDGNNHVVSQSFEYRPDDYEKFNEDTVVKQILETVNYPILCIS